MKTKTNPGDRVGALLSVNPSTRTANLIGYGVYDGNKLMLNITEEDIKEEINKYRMEFPSLSKEKIREIVLETYSNPYILLDSGQHVWGYECWWGPEEEIKNNIRGLTIVNVDIDEERRKIATN